MDYLYFIISLFFFEGNKSPVTNQESCQLPMDHDKNHRIFRTTTSHRFRRVVVVGPHEKLPGVVGAALEGPLDPLVNGHLAKKGRGRHGISRKSPMMTGENKSWGEKR